MTPDFKKAIFSWTYNAEKDGPGELCIPLQLQKLFGMLQLSAQPAVDTVALTKSFGWEGYEVFQQQDVQELTRVLFDALEETFRGTKFENVIDELYAGELVDYIRCIDVDYQSERVDKFLDFSLAIIPFGSEIPLHSLQECIETYLRPEILDGDNKYYCEAFDQRVDAIKGLKFGKLPHIMSIQLKRFVYDFSGDSIVQKKLNDQVKFPMVLDMNKYVAKKKRKPLGTEEEKKEEEELVPNEEFEMFLLEQMQKLKHDKLHCGDHHHHDHDHNQYNAEDDGSAPVLSLADFVLDEDLDTFSLNNLEAINPHNYFHNDITDDPEVPSLVDMENGATPAIATAINDPKSAMTKKDEQDNVCYDSMTIEQMAELLNQRGEWIYELYAVLIHSGAISGGHYFAYIKDLKSNAWYDFNDSSVTLIKEDIVKEAWGGMLKTTYSSAFTMYPSNYGNRLSSSNAYMLMYRKVTTKDCQERIASALQSQEATENNQTKEDDLPVPEYIRNMIALEEEEMLQRLREEEELRDRLQVRVIYQGAQRNVTAKRSMTFQTFLDVLWREFDLASLCLGPSATLQSLQDVNYDLFRLRDYNSYSKIIGSIYDLNVVRQKTLSELLFNDYRAYCLETRTLAQEWEVYIAEGVSILIEEFDHLTQSFLEPRTMRIAKSCTLGELKDLLAKTSSIPRDAMRVMKLHAMGYHEARIDVLTQDEKSLRDFYFVYEHARLHVEHSNHDEDVQRSEALQAFIEIRNKIQIKYNLPLEASLSSPDPTNYVYDQYLNVDSRWKVGELRQFLAEKMNISVDQCRLFKQSAKGYELKDSELTLSANGIYAGMAICVVLGKVTPPGYFSFLLQEFQAKDVVLGVMSLPIFPNPSTELFLGNAVSSGNPWGESDVDIHTTDPKLMDVMKNPSGDDDDETVQKAQEYSVVYPVQEDEDDLLDVDLDQLSNEGQCDIMEDDLDDLIGEVADVSPVPAYAMATAVDGGSNGISTSYAYDAEIEDLTTMTSKVTFDESTTPSADYDVQFPKLRPPTPVLNSKIEDVDIESTPIVPDLIPATDDDVQPSDFGEKMVRNCIESNQFIPWDDLNILVQANTDVQELREMILHELIRSNRVSADFSIKRIRIRDCYNSIITKLLRDGMTLQQSGISITDNKKLTIQLLPEDEYLPEEEQGDAVVMVQRWHRTSWTLSERVEVLFPGNASVSDISKALCLTFDIPVHSLRVLVVPRETSFYMYELCQESPPRNYGRYWFDPMKHTKLMRFMTHDMRVNDGDLIILQNIEEPLKELSRSDKKSMEIVEATLSNNYGWSSLESAAATMPTWYTESSGPVQYQRPQASNGIKIKTQKDRAKTSESQVKVDTATSTTQEGSSEDGLTFSNLVDKTSIIDELNVRNHGGGSTGRYANEGGWCQDCGVGTQDDLEFRRQGGYALFDDLS